MSGPLPTDRVTGGSRSGLVVLALAVSLLFNAFFAVAYFRAVAVRDIARSTDAADRGGTAGPAADHDEREQPAPGTLSDRPTRPGLPDHGRRRDAADRGNDAADRRGEPPRFDPPLDDEQLALWRELHEGQRRDRTAAEAAFDAFRDEFRQLLEADDPSPEALAALSEREAELRQELRAADATRMKEFLLALEPEQRRQAFDLLRADRDRRGGRGPLRFDQDGDGRLDEDERRALEQEREQARRWLIERALHRLAAEEDRDGDDRLDDAEWASLRARLDPDATAPAPPQLARLRERLRTLDENGDGRIDESEWDRLRQQLERGPRRAPGGYDGPDGPRRPGGPLRGRRGDDAPPPTRPTPGAPSTT